MIWRWHVSHWQATDFAATRGGSGQPILPRPRTELAVKRYIAERGCVQWMPRKHVTCCRPSTSINIIYRPMARRRKKTSFLRPSFDVADVINPSPSKHVGGGRWRSSCDIYILDVDWLSLLSTPSGVIGMIFYRVHSNRALIIILHYVRSLRPQTPHNVAERQLGNERDLQY